MKAGIQCYQSGLTIEKPNMTLTNFEWIAKQCKGKCNQFALGGRGDPDQHEEIEKILKICVENHIIPNFTTSGYGLTEEIAKMCKKYCGAIAVSWYRSDYTLKAIKILLDNQVKTNIHYVIGNNTIDEAIKRLEDNSFPKGINAVIFLLHKPAGLGNENNVLSVNDKRIKRFFELIEEKHPFKVGVDSCNVPGAINFCTRILPESLDTCEGGRYSCYIDSEMNMVPCSFDQNQKYAVKLNPISVEEAWNSEEFNEFRNIMLSACPNCEKRELCMGGCPLMHNVVLCQNKCRSIGKS